MKYIKAIKLASFVGFGIILALLWLNELLDLPHMLFGTQPTPVNYKEAVLETFVVILASSVFTIISLRLEKHVKYLEGLTVICANCRKVRVENEWISIDQWLKSKTDVVFSHGVCNECLRELYPEQYRSLVKKRKRFLKANPYGLRQPSRATGSNGRDERKAAHSSAFRTAE